RSSSPSRSARSRLHRWKALLLERRFLDRWFRPSIASGVADDPHSGLLAAPCGLYCSTDIRPDDRVDTSCGKSTHSILVRISTTDAVHTIVPPPLKQSLIPGQLAMGDEPGRSVERVANFRLRTMARVSVPGVASIRRSVRIAPPAIGLPI